MPTTLRVYADEDDALLFWSMPAPLAGCRGFAIARRKTSPDGQHTEDFLPNRMGFENEPVPTAPAADHAAMMKPSTQWPFQRFSWVDHDADTGDTVSYRVIPVIRTAAGALELEDAEASAWSTERTLGTTKATTFKPFFNRGFVMSQFMAHYLAERHLTLAQFKDTISDQDDTTIRQFLSGDLRRALLAELQAARDEGSEIYAALFELSDDELIMALCALGGKAHVVLANGSITAAHGETTAAARQRDENAAARQKLEDAHVDVYERSVAPGALGHNKFLVRVDQGGNPLIAWTGSTNWTPTGLCSQLNNGLLINSPEIAGIYLEQWQRLKAAGSAFPPSLVTANSHSKDIGVGTTGSVRSSIWFSRTSGGVDLDALRAEVEHAREGILFLMFMPGAAGLFSTVAARTAEPNLYVRGVVSELPHGRGDESDADVSLVAGTKHVPFHLDILQPEGVAHPFAQFAEEVTRSQFLAGIGYAIIHSKVVVIDPFSADPVVITGSHNFSSSASAKNDENFIIVRGDRALAEAYAVNIMAAYAHYRWRAFLGQTTTPFNGLKDNDAWQAPMLAADHKELQFWCA